MAATIAAGPRASYEIEPEGSAPDRLRLVLTGDWRLHGGMPPADRIFQELTARGAAPQVAFDTTGLGAWDSGLLAFLLKLDRLGAGNGVTFDPSGLPEGVRRLLRLASAVPERADARRGTDELSLLERVGRRTQEVAGASGEMIGFIGEATVALGRLLRGRARLRGSDFLQILQEVGAQALPIISLVSFLVGMILAFLGAIQLVQFGAQIYVADLVGIGMARDMAAMMVGVILAGRTGAAFAAQLGTMQVNEEIDALVTLGLSPMEFLVLPRMLALILMTPLLCLYANLLGILGGMTVGVLMLDLPAVTYFRETQLAVPPIHFAGGLIKSLVYGIVVAVAGCLRGMQCGRSAAAVGEATTSAVVTSIVFIVIAMALLTIIYDVLGI
jgi:phospholipid/cholesterol/gamma-HCH transport system permease protein